MYMIWRRDSTAKGAKRIYSQMLYVYSISCYNILINETLFCFLIMDAIMTCILFIWHFDR